MTTVVQVEVIETRAGMESLVPEWDALVAKSDVASPFLTPGWQFAWLDSYGRGTSPFVLAARRNGELVGLWPFARRRRGVFRILEPVGARRSDWLDVPVLAECRDDVLAAFMSELLKRRRGWDLVEVRDMLTESPTLPALRAAGASAGLRVRHQHRTIAPFMRMTGTWEQFLESKRAKFRSNLKYYRRLVERNGQRLDIGRVDFVDAQAQVDVMADIEQRSWKVKDGNIKVSTPVGHDFYRRFCTYFATTGHLELWQARVDDAPVAFVLNIVFGGKCYHYNTCYDEKFAFMSPGVLIHADAIADGFGRGLREYDFLSGDEPYKERWCNDRRDIDHLIVSHAGLMSVAARSILVELRWALRRSPFITETRRRMIALWRRMTRPQAASAGGGESQSETDSAGGAKQTAAGGAQRDQEAAGQAASRQPTDRPQAGPEGRSQGDRGGRQQGRNKGPEADSDRAPRDGPDAAPGDGQQRPRKKKPRGEQPPVDAAPGVPGTPAIAGSAAALPESGPVEVGPDPVAPARSVEPPLAGVAPAPHVPVLEPAPDKDPVA